jgi:hypothetical protein
MIIDSHTSNPGSGNLKVKPLGDFSAFGDFYTKVDRIEPAGSGLYDKRKELYLFYDRSEGSHSGILFKPSSNTEVT